jgi:uncharacterized damage-inducible protein DinB
VDFNVYKKMVGSQFGATFKMLENALGSCSQELWDDRSRGKPFWYLVYHTLFFIDLYLSESLTGFAPPAPFTLSEIEQRNAIPEKAYSKEELSRYLDHGRKKLYETLSNVTEAQALQRCGFRWIDGTVAELFMYNMRHAQHHAGQLNLILRQSTDSAPGWVFKIE